MITYADFKKFMLHDLQGKYCIEVNFSVGNMPTYDHCWMGKMPEENGTGELYWFGLVKDGSEAYDYTNFEELVSAPVFGGKSFQEIWDDVEWITLNGCNPEEYIRYYL